KALYKKVSERYTTAKDMAQDLRAWQTGYQNPTPAVKIELNFPSPPPTTLGCRAPSLPSGTSAVDQQVIKIVPKGLRSFEASDSDFFLELLPGPRDRDRLPDSIRFWKTRIEERDPDKTFPVGLLYGPSGCGKSSLVKAGLLPRLADSTIAVYIEATPDDTEARLLKGLRRYCPNRALDLGLAEAVTALRRGQGLAAGKKVLIVLDQFEQ